MRICSRGSNAREGTGEGVGCVALGVRGLAGESLSLEAGFENLKTHAIPNLLFPASGLRCERLPLSCSCHHGCHLLL